MVEVHDNPAELRFEISEDGKLAGFARYVRRPGRIFFVHTEVFPAFEGRGLARQLAAAALDKTRAAGEQVVPLCTFIAKYIADHPGYDDIVDHDLIAHLG